MAAKLNVIIGLGKTGLSCVRYLSKQGKAIAVNDSRPNPPALAELQAQFPNVAVHLGGFNNNICEQAEALIVSPGVSLHEPAIANAIAKGVPAFGDIELFAQKATAPIIAITGSNGKSTVTTLVSEMVRYANLNVNVGGNLGTPALELLTQPEPAFYVLELSSFQLETTHSLKPKAAVVLNISEDHMDRYNSLTEYLAAKQRIYHHCEFAIVNRDDPIVWQDLVELKQHPHLVSFGLNKPEKNQFGLQETADGEYLALGDQLLMKTSELRIKGRHQIANALAALALGHSAGLPMTAILEALRNFSGIPHRCQWIVNHNDVDWYNDSKATNIASAQAAINGLGSSVSGKLVVIAGGMGKNADFTALRDTMKKHVRTLILIGQDAFKIANALAQTTQIVHATSLEQATSLANQYAQPGDAVVLAPACASFDMFRDFEHRGEAFMTAVRALFS